MENYEEQYYKHVMNEEKATGAYAIVFDIIHDLSDRRGLKQEWYQIDDEIQDEIVETWVDIVEKHIETNKNVTK